MCRIEVKNGALRIDVDSLTGNTQHLVKAIDFVQRETQGLQCPSVGGVMNSELPDRFGK
ncbi:hypothetical protein [Paraburkholderia phenazinium]|jgi:hypothetical protein|uniref:Uncharacterized protein n=1 Tax=Paraburkholderia phenazinium TaxID=60549 RepID=A0A1G8BL29_9BURK|nr:hypothetical protein [Paraburkholderia phenazinium]SDH33818.1 hypothetical protein SAMN05216466_10981 [Paraburkholderia phenazinium]